MGKLILEMQMSVDGYVAGPDGQTDWMVWNWGANWTWDVQLQNFHTQLTLSAEWVIISRQMAEEGFIAHWRQAAERQDEQAIFAGHLSRVPKTVISTTLTKDREIPGGWENVTLADDLAVIDRLKQELNDNILVYGGAALVSGLLKRNLIDELYLLVNPVAIGDGLSIFSGLRHFQLKEAKGFPSGVTLLHYSA